MKARITCIFQELCLISNLTAANNIGITSAPTRLSLIDLRSHRLPEDARARAGACPLHLYFVAIEQFSPFGLIDREAKKAAIGPDNPTARIRSVGIEGSPSGVY
jgi:hypothetical protein